MSDDEAPVGYVYAWVPTTSVDHELRWALLPEPDPTHLCRGDVNCPNHPVAKMNRSTSAIERWWFYCANHLYGRRINNGVLETRIIQPASEGEAA